MNEKWNGILSARIANGNKADFHSRRRGRNGDKAGFHSRRRGRGGDRDAIRAFIDNLSAFRRRFVGWLENNKNGKHFSEKKIQIRLVAIDAFLWRQHCDIELLTREKEELVASISTTDFWQYF